MKAFLEEEVVELIELLDFVADLCVGQPEELNVALCRFTLSYYPAAELEAAVPAWPIGCAVRWRCAHTRSSRECPGGTL